MPFRITCIVIVVLAALIWANLRFRDGSGVGSNWAMTCSYTQGWPTPFRNFTIQESYGAGDYVITNRETLDSTIVMPGAMVDVLVACLIVCCVVIACRKHRVRKSRHFQLSLADGLFLFSFIAIVVYVYANQIGAAIVLAQFLDEEPSIFWYLGSEPLYTVLPIGFGITCVGSVTVSLIFRACRRILGVSDQRSIAEQHRKTQYRLDAVSTMDDGKSASG